MQARLPKVVLALLAGLSRSRWIWRPGQTPKGLAGTWTQLAKSKFSPGPPPKSMTVTYTPSG